MGKCLVSCFFLRHSVDGEVDKGWLTIKTGVSGCMFFSGTGSPGSPGQRAVKRLLLLLLLLEEQSIEMTQERHVQTSPNLACDRGSVLLQQR